MDRRWIGLFGALLFAPTVASAAAPRFWVALTGGVGTYVMSDVNDEIKSINAIISPLHMNELSSGLGFGGMAGVDVSTNLVVSAGFERLTGSTSVGDSTGGLKYDLPANAFRASFEYRAPATTSFVLGVGGSAGLISSAGAVTVSVTGSGSNSGELKGTGPLFEGFVTGDWHASPQIAITPVLGFRYANIASPEVNGRKVAKADGSTYSLQYSGVFARVALKLELW